MTNYLITIIGPTAIGKTSLAIKLAKYFNTEIISADSRQFFKEMCIGTAVPSATELEAAQHHFIQHKSIFENYNVGEFEREAIEKIDELFKKNKFVVLVGGSGLYVDSVIKGLDDFPPIKPEIRDKLTDILVNEGIESLQNQLKQLDLDQYKIVDLNNSQRVIRALEVCISSGKPYSSFLAKNKIKRSFQTIKIGLNTDREIIYDRINQRVDIMLENGLMKEAQGLIEHKNLNALQTVGYRELFEYFDGLITKEKAIEEIKKNTRRFAKRQLTWYRKDE
ncbi:MAG: tRNA (adenosine(37)-N6)-dimethylallyltransferase MiaA, partial [Leeuwenhoekiella sp.]